MIHNVKLHVGKNLEVRNSLWKAVEIQKSNICTSRPTCSMSNVFAPPPTVIIRISFVFPQLTENPNYQCEPRHMAEGQMHNCPRCFFITSIIMWWIGRNLQA
jgi:hypothetical protein